MRRHTEARRAGFSLLEVVIVVAIVAILAAIGIPRMSRGAKGANDSALSGDLATLRNAIDLYAAEHMGAYPKIADCNNELTKYTDRDGNVNATKTTVYAFGPYIRAIPAVPVPVAKKGCVKIAAADAVGVGWIYNEAEGTISVNATAAEKDDWGKAYKDY